MLTKIRKAQSTLEYALILAVVVGALLTMQNYLKRSLQGKLQATADEIGPQYSPGLTQKTDHLSSKVDRITETSNSGYNGRYTTQITGGHQDERTNKEIKSLDTERWIGNTTK